MATHKREYGQVLVVVALGLLGLLAFVALAIDVGGAYQERRAMQNAADAGALAGARELCFGSETAADDVAWDYTVNRNGAAGAQITVTSPTTVTVVATQTYVTYFAGLFGFGEIAVNADATAVCGKSEAVGDLWPVGFDKDRWMQAVDEINCWDRVIIWQGDNQVNCGNPTTNPSGLNCCTLYKDKNKADVLEYLSCDANYVPKMYPLDRAAWVDFTAGLTADDPCEGNTSGGVGADEIKYRIDGENNKGEACTPYLSLPDCYAGGVGSGVANSGWLAAEKIVDGRIVHIPLYDPYASGKNVPGDITIAEEAGVSDPTNVYSVCEITDSKSGGNESYYIDALMCLQIGIYHADENKWWVI